MHNFSLSHALPQPREEKKLHTDARFLRNISRVKNREQRESHRSDLNQVVNGTVRPSRLWRGSPRDHRGITGRRIALDSVAGAERCRRAGGSADGELPASGRPARRLDLGPVVAIDTETMGLYPARDRLCLVQLSAGRRRCAPRADPPGETEAPNLDGDAGRSRHAEAVPLRAVRYRDAAQPLRRAGAPVYCTKIASRLVRTYTDRHGLKDLARELLERRHLQAAAIERLGGRRCSPRRSSSTRPPTCSICTG